MINPLNRRFRFLVRRADAARDEQRFDAAAALYEEALRLKPHHSGMMIQHAHMLKETGKLDRAETLYIAAQAARPNDADLALQLGHFYKVAARPGEARLAFERAIALQPGWDAPARELAMLDQLPLRPGLGATDPDDIVVDPARLDGDLAHRSSAELARLVPALAPRRPDELLRSHGEEIAVRRMGRRESGFWGNRTTLRGIEGARGFCISAKPIVEVQVILDGVRIQRGPIAGGFVLKLEADKQRVKKYVFNLWIDLTPYANGLHLIELRFIDVDDGARSYREEVVIAAPLPAAAYPDSNFLVSVSPDDPRGIEEQIRAQPSMVRSAKRALFPDGVRNVLVMRTDQLGDMVASVPALTRLRTMLPDARIVGLMTPANAELGRTFDFFDEIIVINFPDDPVERRRLMPLDEQEALRRRLEPYAFDIALDLAQAPVSRDLLRLSGAKFTYGTGGEDWPWLSSDFMFHTRDRWNRHDFTPHSSKVLALVETLGTLLKTSTPILRRDDLSRDMLTEYGLAPDEPFALLHTGARIGFSRWPHYAELARMFLAETDFRIVIMTEDAGFRATMPAELLDDPRIIFLDTRLPFDHFDAFVSYADVMTGNDSGPKHLASLRGTQVVTIFSARINWTEWGQENVGSIISRKLPCAGCALLHDPEECGRDFICVTDIKAREVFDAMMALIAVPAVAA